MMADLLVCFVLLLLFDLLDVVFLFPYLFLFSLQKKRLESNDECTVDINKHLLNANRNHAADKH